MKYEVAAFLIGAFIFVYSLCSIAKESDENAEKIFDKLKENENKIGSQPS